MFEGSLNTATYRCVCYRHVVYVKPNVDVNVTASDVSSQKGSRHLDQNLNFWDASDVYNLSQVSGNPLPQLAS